MPSKGQLERRPRKTSWPSYAFERISVSTRPLVEAKMEQGQCAGQPRRFARDATDDRRAARGATGDRWGATGDRWGATGDRRGARFRTGEGGVC